MSRPSSPGRSEDDAPWDPHPWLVPAQVAAVAAHALPGGPGVRPPAGLRALGACAVVGGGALAAAAAAQLGRDLTPAVVPREGAGLRTDGLYGYSRHPLYAGLLLGSAGVVLLRGRLVTSLAAAALAGVLHVKAGAEDRVLAERFGGEWRRWSGRVPRLVGLRRA